MAITSRNILHTDMKCDEFHDELSIKEKHNLVNKLDNYISVLRSEIRCHASLIGLHEAVDKHHAEFGIKYTLSRDLPLKVLKDRTSYPDSGSPVQEALAKVPCQHRQTSQQRLEEIRANTPHMGGWPHSDM